jgi:hypothetical protein
MRTYSTFAAAALLTTALVAPARADQILPAGRVVDSGDILFGTLKLGRRNAGKTTLQPDAIQIKGPGSTGPIDAMTVTSPQGFTRTTADRAGDVLNAADCGASPTATAATNAAAFATCATKAKVVQINEGIYQVAGTASSICLPGIIGRGSARTVLVNTTTDQPTIRVPNGCVSMRIEGLSLDRVKNDRLYNADPANQNAIASAAIGLTAVAGADGLRIEGYTSNIVVRDVASRWNYNNFVFGATNAGTLSGLNAIQAVNDGIQTGNGSWNLAATVPVQWKFTGERSLSAQNQRDGYNVIATPGGVAVQITVSDWDGIQSYKNGRNAVSALGTPTLSVQGMRLRGVFLGEDIGNEVYLDTYGGKHVIDASFLELAGSYSLRVTANNSGVRVVGGTLSGSPTNCVFSESPLTDISGTLFENCGLNTGLPAASRGSMLLTGADTTVRSFISTGGSYAVLATGARNAVIDGMVRGATTAPIAVQSDAFVRSIRAFNTSNTPVTVPDAN